MTRNGTAEPVSRDQVLRHVRGQGNINFPFSADHEQDWQPYPVEPYSSICDDHTCIHTYILSIELCDNVTITPQGKSQLTNTQSVLITLCTHRT